MKNVFVIVLILILGNFAWCQTNPNHVRVQGYTKQDGTYVPTHMRTAPNGTNRDNFSTKPNTNPYTGQPGWITPDNNPLPTYGGSTYAPSPIYPSSNGGFPKPSLYDSYPKYETKGRANLREQMSTSSAIVETLPQGASVKVVNSFFGEWWEVYYDGHRGYMHSSLLTFVSSGETRTTLSGYNFDNSSLYDRYPTYETKSRANLREQMSTSSAIIETLPQGASVKVVNSFFGEWWEVYYDGRKGYMHSSLLNFISSGKERESLNPNIMLSSSYERPSETTNTLKVDPNKIYKTNKIVSLRATPNPRSIELRLVGMYEKVRVIEFRGDWAKIEYNDKSGWVEKSAISVQ